MKMGKGIILGALSLVLALGMFGCASSKEDKADDVAAKKEAAEQKEASSEQKGSFSGQESGAMPRNPRPKAPVPTTSRIPASTSMAT